VIRQQDLTSNDRLWPFRPARTFEDLVDVREIASVAIATLASGGAAHPSLLPLIVQHGVADLLELFFFAGLDFAAS
jgi:hypothetical protein